MALSRLGTRSRPGDFTWPGFVDALASLLMVFVFVLMVFVLIQANLAYRVSGQDASLSRLRAELSALTGLLNLEREASADLSLQLAQTSTALASLTDERDFLQTQLADMTSKSAAQAGTILQLQSQLTANLSLQAALNNQLSQLEDKTQSQGAKIGDLQARLDEEAARLLLMQKELSENQIALADNLAALEETSLSLEEREKRILVLEADLIARETELAAKTQMLARLSAKLETQQTELTRQAETIAAQDALTTAANNATLEAKAEIDQLILAATVLQAELDNLRGLLADKERESVRDKIAIANLGKSLNNALASRVQELQRFRSEFFGQVRTLLEGRADVQVVGDRFVFQSEVLFAPGQARINPAGEQQLAQIGQALVDIAALIPDDIPWVLQVDGHTDDVPVTSGYADNWDLSTERALSVVRFFIAQGVPADRLAATGFGEFQPIDKADTDEARQRNRRIELKLTNRVQAASN